MTMWVQPKPIVSRAQQWFPPGDERHDPTMLSNRKGRSVKPPDYLQPGDLIRFSPLDAYYLRGETANDHTSVNPGDWIITAPDGSKRVVRNLGDEYEVLGNDNPDSPDFDPAALREPNETELAALEIVRKNKFIERLVAGEFDKKEPQ